MEQRKAAWSSEGWVATARGCVEQRGAAWNSEGRSEAARDGVEQQGKERDGDTSLLV